MKSILKSNKISLRAVEPTDLDIIMQWENNPEFWPVSNTLTPFSKELLDQYVHSAQDIYSVKQIRLIIDELASHKTVGAIDLFDFDPRHQHAGVGILIDPDFRKKGFAADAIALIKKYARDIVGIRNLSATIIEDNQASIQLFEKAGFRKIGQRKKWFNKGDVWLDELIYQCELV
jgi:diamine N-acetyltransferase